MSVYINADRIVDKVCEGISCNECSFGTNEDGMSECVLDKRIAELPTADVREVVHGEWIKMDKRGNNVQCSKCGNTLDLRGVNAGRGDANYCPNCGAKMSTQSNAFLTH